MLKRTLLPKFSRIENPSFPRLVSMLLLVTAGQVLMPVLGQAPAKPSIRPLVLTHISVVDVASGLAGSDQTVVVRGNRIAEIGPSSRFVVPRDAEIIDGAGKYLIPGLADMHNHLVNPSGTAEDPVRSLAQLLRWGVTTVFSPAMAMEDDKRVKHATEGEPANLPRFYGVGPAFTARGGHMAHFEHHGVEIPATPEDARSQVRALKSASVDAVKVMTCITLEGLLFPPCNPRFWPRSSTRRTVAASRFTRIPLR